MHFCITDKAVPLLKSFPFASVFHMWSLFLSFVVLTSPSFAASGWLSFVIVAFPVCVRVFFFFFFFLLLLLFSLIFLWSCQT